MPKTRSQSLAAERRQGQAAIVDPPTNITTIDLAKRVVRWARALHFVAATMEDIDSTKIGLIDRLQQAGSNAVVTARKLRNFHDDRWRESEEKRHGRPRQILYGGEDDDDSSGDEDDVEADIEAQFDQAYTMERAVSIAINIEVKIVTAIGERREAMIRLRDPDGASFLAHFIDKLHDSIAKWERVETTLTVCQYEGGDAAIDMVLRRNWLK